jgi:hypothetical protein
VYPTRHSLAYLGPLLQPLAKYVFPLRNTRHSILTMNAEQKIVGVVLGPVCTCQRLAVSFYWAMRAYIAVGRFVVGSSRVRGGAIEYGIGRLFAFHVVSSSTTRLDPSRALAGICKAHFGERHVRRPRLNFESELSGRAGGNHAHCGGRFHVELVQRFVRAATKTSAHGAGYF